MKLSFSVDEFCEAHSISRATFYALHKRGAGPRLMKVGRRTLVSAEAAAEWRSAMEQHGDLAPAVRRSVALVTPVRAS